MRVIKERLDKLLVTLELVDSRLKAQTLIKDKQVKVDGIIVDKCSKEFEPGVEIEIMEDIKYVGRGALKLLEAFKMFDINVEGKICCDIGASTGGFTQILLERGAVKVYAVDVGTAQLHSLLKNDKRVISMENTDARTMTLPEEIDFLTCDVSFISVKKFAEVFNTLLRRGMEGIILIKPQFEAGRDALDRNGIIKDPGIHDRVIFDIGEHFRNNGFKVKGIITSPIKGGDGNKEFLMWIERD